MKIKSIKGALFADQNCMQFSIIPRKVNNQKPEKVVIFRKKKKQTSFYFMSLVFLQQSQVTADYSDPTL